jgi:RNA polymerase sigma factor (sigma-70 family)
MATLSDLRNHINEHRFVERLKQNEEAAVRTLIAYVRAYVGLYARRRRYAYASEEEGEFADDALALIYAHLGNFQAIGKFSAYCEQLIGTAMSNPYLKNLLQAISRLLDIAQAPPDSRQRKLLPDSRQRELRAFIMRRPATDRELLLGYLEDKRQVSLANNKRWCIARRELLHEPGFRAFLDQLAREGYPQARTVLNWEMALQGSVSLETPTGDESDGETIEDRLPDRGPLPDKLYEENEEKQALLNCLERLRRVSNNQYQVLVLQYYHDKPYDEIAVSLGVSYDTVRQWAHRGKVQIKQCMERSL